jgi:helicase required for RNAi-mediated heterochromatin assembly 1
VAVTTANSTNEHGKFYIFIFILDSFRLHSCKLNIIYHLYYLLFVILPYQFALHRNLTVSYPSNLLSRPQNLAKYFPIEFDPNIDFVERFGRGTRLHRRDQPKESSSHIQDEGLRTNNIRTYVEKTRSLSDPGSWVSAAEIPTTAEICDVIEPWQRLDPEDGSIVLRGNNLQGPWTSKSDYLMGHYEMLREEAVRPLREAVYWVKNNPTLGEDQRSFGGNMGIYEKAHVTANTFSNRGIGIRLNFSLSKVGKNIRWEQSKRLLSGTLVALTPSSDMFQTKCIIAVVAARPLDGLKQNPPTIDLFFARPDEIEIDPQIEFTMVEERASFFEAGRHTMSALQQMMREP